MEIITELKKQSVRTSGDDFRTIDPIKAGSYKMSVQGSAGHYCSPREVTKIEYYDRMELALFSRKGWLQIKRSSVLKNFPRYSELIERAENPRSCACVFGYVPIDLLNDLYLYLKNH